MYVCIYLHIHTYSYVFIHIYTTGITTTGFTEEGVVIAPIASAWNYQFFAEEVFYMKQGLRQKTYPTYLTPKRLGLPKRSEQEKKTEQEAIKSAIASAFGLPQYNIQTVYARVHKVARPHYDVDEED